MAKFQELIAFLSEVCSTKNFKKSGLSYWLEKAGNTAIINIQKSQYQIPDGSRFTINAGIHYKSLFYFNNTASLKKSTINDCQWKVRVGELMDIKKDYWWEIYDKDKIDLISAEFERIINSVIYAAIEDRISNKQYIEKLIANENLGTEIIKRLSNLCSFLCMYDDPRLPMILDELRMYCSKYKLNEFYEAKVAQIENWKKRPGQESTWVFGDEGYGWV